MRRTGLLLSLVLLAAPVWAQQGTRSYTPSRPAEDVPTFVNAEVVRVEASGTVTFRTESGVTVVRTSDEALRGVAGLRAGDKVILTYRTRVDEQGVSRRVVTDVEIAAPTSGEPSRAGATTGTTVVTPGGGVIRGAPTKPARPAAEVVPAPAAPAPAAAPPASPAAVGSAVPTTPPVSPFVSNVPSVPAPNPEVTAVLPPAGAKAPQSDAEVGRLREQGVRDLDAAAVVLAAAANDIGAEWTRYENACVTGPKPEAPVGGRSFFLLFDNRVPPPGSDACRQQLADLNTRASAFKSQLEIATDAARKADVLPGTIREILERHRLAY